LCSLVTLLYRLPRHPLIANLLLPPLVFLLLYCTPLDTPRNWRSERRSVHLTNLALLVMFATLVTLIGWREVLLIHVAVIAVSSVLGVWSFSLQHRFDSTHWASHVDWRFVEAASTAHPGCGCRRHYAG
jgi:omega-6 fatty acid desaturase (delta-12 desaturase)